jgi:hypothetical protein
VRGQAWQADTTRFFQPLLTLVNLKERLPAT